MNIYLNNRKENYRWLAFDAANGDLEMFKTFNEAVAWLTDNDGEGISIEAEQGDNWIAEIQYKSVVTPLEKKEDYCECMDREDRDSDVCEICGKEEVWPYDSNFDYIADHRYERIDYGEDS